MKSYAADLKGEEGIVKYSKYVEDFYKREHAIQIIALEKHKQELTSQIDQKNQEIQALKLQNNQLNASNKSLTDQNFHLRKKDTEHLDTIKSLKEDVKNSVPLNYGKPEKSGRSLRHIQLED